METGVQKSGLAMQIQNEIQQYLNEVVDVSQDYQFSQSKLVRRIVLFENHIYPSGKFDSQGNYKFWYDIITSRINSEVKNIDFDTKDIRPSSDRKIDFLPNLITTLKIKEWLRDNGQADEINSAIEEGSGWGNLLWKKIKGSYERCDLKNIMVINQTAQCVDETPIIERQQMSQSDVREKSGSWKYVSEILTSCKSNSYSSSLETSAAETTVPYYDVYERNGEVKLSDLKIENGETPDEGDDEKYVLAKVIGVGVKSETAGSAGVEIKYIAFAGELGKKMSDVYKEFHRGRYKGRWWREGLIELLFDLQVRANQVGNQLAQGLEWASKIIFSSEDKLIIQNIMSDLKNGSVIKSKDIKQVSVVLNGFSELANEWNRILQLADNISNSSEIIQGDNTPSGQPLGTTVLLNQNTNKLYTFIREKLAIPLSEIFEQWIIPDLVRDLKQRDVIRLTGDSDMMDRLYEIIVQDWYLNNLIEIGPHTKEIAEALKAEKMDELKSRPELLMREFKKLFEDYYPHVSVVITGEQMSLQEDLQSMQALAQLEPDPIRKQAIVEEIAKRKGYDFGSLPKSPPAPVTAGTVASSNQPVASGSEVKA